MVLTTHDPVALEFVHRVVSLNDAGGDPAAGSGRTQPITPPDRPSPASYQAGSEVFPGYQDEALMPRGGRVDTYDVYSRERDCRAVIR